MTAGPTKAEAEMALESLLDKHQRWLLMQPELLLLWEQGRSTRRRVAELLAKELLTIPVRQFNENTPPNRATRKAIVRELDKAGVQWWQGE